MEKKSSLGEIHKDEEASLEEGLVAISDDKPMFYTPSNSVNELAGGNLKETDLPSFHSSDMVDKIMDKRASMKHNTNDDVPQETKAFPFTPQNSFADGHFDAFAKKHNISNIAQALKEESIEENRILESEEHPQEPEADKFPFTPKNSFTEENLHGFAKEHNLPSFNSAEMVQKIKDKKSAMGSNEEQNSENSAPTENSTFPFTPQNSFADDSPLNQYSKHLPGINMETIEERVNKKKKKMEDEGEDDDEDDEEEEEVIESRNKKYDDDDD
ncbi:unnamed protein product, partial [Owenia fusiformis]